MSPRRRAASTHWVNPDCLVGKHPSCSGTAWDEEADELVSCDCQCHQDEP